MVGVLAASCLSQSEVLLAKAAAMVNGAAADVLVNTAAASVFVDLTV